MHQTQRIRLSCAAALAATALASGCTTDAGASLIVVQNQVPGADCVIPADQGSEFRGRGRIDVKASEGYILTPLVQSLVSEDETGNNPRVVQVHGADVDVELPSGLFSADEAASLEDQALTRFSQAFTGSVFPGGTASFGFVVVPRGLLARMDDVMADGDEALTTVEVTVFGDLDGGEVESGPFRYPIDVCDGCMKVVYDNCDSLGADFQASEGGECNALQDVPLECCLQGTTEVCPAEPGSAD